MRLVIQNLKKTYPNGVKALEGIDLTIEQGMFGLLGPNGAGKSSIMKILATLLEPDHGMVHLEDIDVLQHKNELRKVLGYLPQEFGVYEKISAEYLLNHIAILKGITDKHDRKETVEILLEKTNLYASRKRAVCTYSGGMKQRFGIAQALLGNPKLVIVDEPTSGLDPGERNRFYDLLSEIGEGIIVILSTHIVEDVKELCNNMAIINHGAVLFQGRPKDALQGIHGKIWEKEIQKFELTSHKNDYEIISSRLLGGRPILHAYSNEPLDNFEKANPELEDFYFLKIRESEATINSLAV